MDHQRTRVSKQKRGFFEIKTKDVTAKHPCISTKSNAVVKGAPPCGQLFEIHGNELKLAPLRHLVKPTVIGVAHCVLLFRISEHRSMVSLRSGQSACPRRSAVCPRCGQCNPPKGDAARSFVLFCFGCTVLGRGILYSHVDYSYTRADLRDSSWRRQAHGCVDRVRNHSIRRKHSLSHGNSPASHGTFGKYELL